MLCIVGRPCDNLLVPKELSLLTRRLSTKPRLGQALSLPSLGILQSVESPSDGFSIDAEFNGEVRLMLAATDPSADLLQIGIGEFEGRSHIIIVLAWDILWDISMVRCAPLEVTQNACI